MPFFDKFDFAKFWDNDEYAQKEYIGRPLTKEMLDNLQRELRFALPPAYIEFLTIQNGGVPFFTCHRTAVPTSWAEDHVAITSIFGADPEKSWALSGEHGNGFWISEWGYPDIGIYFADCPSAGHDMLCLDYRKCGPQGIPQVVHVEQEQNYEITFVAPSFEAFIHGLEHDDAFDFDESSSP